MTDRDLPNRFNPDRPNQLPPELATFLRQQQYAAILHATDLGTSLIVKAPGHEIASVRGQVPILQSHELYDHYASPVIRMVTRIFDRPIFPLTLETFVNVGDPDQRADYDVLSRQDSLVMLFYDDGVQHRLTKRVRTVAQLSMRRVIHEADRMLERIPPEFRNFDIAKMDVMAQTGM